jgi:hypothetical protein
MTITIPNAFVAARDFEADATGAPGGAIAKSVGGAPILPAGWVAQAEGNGFYTCTRTSDGVRVLAWRANILPSGTQALYAVWGPRTLLDALADAMPAIELWTLAQGGNATAIAVVRRWPFWRCSGTERLQTVSDPLVPFSGVRRLFFTDGQLTPAPPLPTPGAPWRFGFDGAQLGADANTRLRITAIDRPALGLTLAGFPLDAALETEPPR